MSFSFIGKTKVHLISTGQLDIRIVDIGNPMFTMHSVHEMGGVKESVKYLLTFLDNTIYALCCE
ncbi:MAG: hypothetical protein JKX79_01580 [Labilibaculum sp.]|nr:hypothetical protein [Labilibaculum sp.]